MARYQSVQTNFRVGQISPRLQGYVDLPDYQNGLKLLENMVVVPQSSVTRRPGTRYVSSTLSGNEARLVPFNFGQGESYILEFTSGNIRIFYNNPSTGTPELIPDTGELGSITQYADLDGTLQDLPYSASDLEELNWTQSADTLFLTHPSYPPLRLKRSAPASGATQDLSDWSADQFPFDDGPYLPVNNELTWLRFSNVGNADYGNQKIGEIPTGSGGGVDHTTLTLTLTNHGLVDGDEVYFDMPTGTMPANIVSGTAYFVVQATTNTFKISESRDGAPFEFTDDGSNNDLMHVHKTFVHAGGAVTLTAYEGTRVEQCTVNQSTGLFTTAEAHGLLEDDEVHFKTSTVDGFSLDTSYYVLATGLTTTAFKLAASAGGTAIASIGSQTAAPVSGLFKMEKSSTHINNGAGFTSADEGRLIRINSAVSPTIKWGYVKILSAPDTETVNVKVIEDLGPPNETQKWALGAFSEATGYPRCVAIYQQRMVFAGTLEEPQTVHFSKTGDYTNFSSTEAIGEQTGIGIGGIGIFNEQVYDDNAITLSISAETVDRITYLVPSEQLTIGTTGGIFQMFGARDDITLTPFNFSVIKIAAWASNPSRPVEIGKTLLYAQQNGRKIRALDYSKAQDEYSADDLTIRSDNITASGIKEMVYQDQPNALVWCRRADGKLACLTFISSVPLIAWHLHTIGGSFNSGNAVVESIAVIPQTDHDQLWMVVKRDIWGGMTAVSSVTLNETTGVFTKNAHGYSDGDKLAFDSTAPSGFDPGRIYYVVSSATNTFSLASTASGTAINPNGTDTAAAVSTISTVDYSVSRYVEVMQKFFDATETDIEDAWFVDCGQQDTGTALASVTLSHLAGEDLTVLGDGAPQPNRTANSSGVITLELAADKIVSGLGYNSNIQTLPLVVGDRQRTNIGQRKRIHRIFVQLIESVGLKYGTEVDSLLSLDFRLTSDLLDNRVPLFSGEKELVMQSAYTKTGEIYLRQDQALPFTVILIATDYETND